MSFRDTFKREMLKLKEEKHQEIRKADEGFKKMIDEVQHKYSELFDLKKMEIQRKLDELDKEVEETKQKWNELDEETKQTRHKLDRDAEETPQKQNQLAMVFDEFDELIGPQVCESTLLDEAKYQSYI